MSRTWLSCIRHQSVVRKRYYLDPNAMPGDLWERRRYKGTTSTKLRHKLPRAYTESNHKQRMRKNYSHESNARGDCHIEGKGGICWEARATGANTR